MNCPTIEEIERCKNDQYILARWYRFCEVTNSADVESMNLIMKYFKGFNSQLSKQVGWDRPNA